MNLLVKGINLTSYFNSIKLSNFRIAKDIDDNYIKLFKAKDAGVNFSI